MWTKAGMTSGVIEKERPREGLSMLAAKDKIVKNES